MGHRDDSPRDRWVSSPVMIMKVDGTSRLAPASILQERALTAASEDVRRDRGDRAHRALVGSARPSFTIVVRSNAQDDIDAQIAGG